VSAVGYEWARLRGVRSTWWGTAAVLALGAATTFTAARALGTAPADAVQAADLLTARTGAIGTPLTASLVCALAAITAGGDLRRSVNPQALLVLPQRTRLFTAKAVTCFLLALFGALLSLAGNLLTAQAVFGTGLHTLDWQDAPALRVLGGYTGYLTAAALLGFAVGVTARGTVSAVVAVTALPYAVEPLLATTGRLLLPEAHRNLIDYLPFRAADRMIDTTGPGLSPASGAIVFAAWTVGALLLALMVFVRRRA
jgi:ABC-2 type transport system permease protein